MKRVLYTAIFLALFSCMNSVVFASELLDVKPIIVGDTVSIEISADIGMAYVFNKVPGQARAIIDIAEVDPEKVEPLIVVNKGVVSSISVDKAQISGVIVSRIIFNLVSETDISVTASPDRKMLTVTFGGLPVEAGKLELKPEPKPDPNPDKPSSSTSATPQNGANKLNPTFGADDPTVKQIAPPAKTATTATVGSESPRAAPALVRVHKLEPVVPASFPPVKPSALTVKEIATRASYIEILTNQPVTNYKAFRMSGPERLVIDLAGSIINQKPKSESINKFGITKVRIGVSPKNIRIVFDSGKAIFPSYTITNTDDGLRINFK